MANCLTKNWQAPQLINLVKTLNLNILLFSIGIQETLDTIISENLNDDIKYLMSVTKYPIYVRGQYSSDLLTNLNIPNIIIGCPSFIDVDIININIKYPKRIAFQCTFTHPNEKNFLLFGIENNFNYIVQGEYNFKVLKYEMLKDSKNKLWDDFKVLDSLSYELLNLLKELIIIPESLQDWKKIVLEFDFIITTRLHGHMIALQQGIPSLLIIIDKRTEEVANFFDLPSIRIDKIQDFNTEFFWNTMIKQFEKFNSNLLRHKHCFFNKTLNYF
jgi:polysaccharide pyruvyl transferase WcaK-like protein